VEDADEAVGQGSQGAVVGEFAINGSDYADWTEFSKATQTYIRRRNRDRHDPRILELENRRKVD